LVHAAWCTCFAITEFCSALKRSSLQRDLGKPQGNQSWYANPQQQQQQQQQQPKLKQPFAKKRK
jgi:hypothetical protein